MGKRKYQTDAASLYSIPSLGTKTFVIGASRAALGLFIVLGLWRENTPLGRILTILLAAAVLLLGVTDKRVSCRNTAAAVLDILLFAGGPALMLALAGSLWAIAGFVWTAALLGILYAAGRK